MAFVGNDILLSSKMLRFGDLTPFVITQDANGVVSFAMKYSDQFKVETIDGVSTLKLKTVAITDIDGLSTKLGSIETSYSTLSGEFNDLTERVDAIDGEGGFISVTNGELTTIKGDITTINGTLTTVNADLVEIKKDIEALEAGTIDLSAYTSTDKISLTTSAADGIKFITTAENSTVTVNGNAVVTEDQMVAYQLVSAKDAANGYAGLDANSKLAVAQLPIDGTTIVVKDGVIAVSADKVATLTDGKLATDQLPIDNETLAVKNGVVAVDPTKVAVLNAEGKIGRDYLESINLQETFGATISGDSVTITNGSLADVEIGDAIITEAGEFYYRVSTANGNINDFTKLVRDIASASTADINAGTSSDLYITPAALKNSAPALDGANFTNIPGTAVAKATADTQGTVKVSAQNGLALTDGVISVGLASAEAFGTVKVTAQNGLAIADGVISVGVASTDAFGTVKVTAGNGLAVNAGVISMAAATATTAGAVVLSGKGIKAGADGAFDVALVTDANTLVGDGGETALEVKLDPAGALVATEAGIGLAIDETLLAIEDNKLVNKAVSSGQLEGAIEQALIDALAAAKAALKQADIKVVKGTNYVNNKIEFTAIQHPQGIRHASDGRFFAVNPKVVVSGNTRTYTIDVTGLTCLDEGEWYITF
jgi:hypothetical protein